MALAFDQEPQLERLPGIAHAFFGRRGGVSEGPFASLNVSLRNADRAEHVVRNRELIATTFERAVDDLAMARQVHGVTVHRVTRSWGLGMPPEADALLTTEPGVIVGATTADCAPLLLAAPAVPAVAAVHAGWKGALDGVAVATIEALLALGARADGIHAAIGPCIARESYEVGPDFKARFLERDGAYEAHFSNDPVMGKPHLDLRGFLDAQLRRCGVSHIGHVRRDTYADAESFFSFRRTTHEGGGGYGVHLSAIAIES